MSFLNKIIFCGAFMGAFGAYLNFFRGPAANEQQRLFRIGIGVAGLAIMLIGGLLKLVFGKSQASAQQQH